MANPTGSTYLQANNSYVWIDGDVYQIPQTDQVEGAATGASFSGIGVDNQPHQVMLNKVQWLHNRLVADEATITTLQSLQNLILSSAGPSGWLKLTSNDVLSNSAVQIFIQWGFISFAGIPGSQAVPKPISFNFPIRFPNACWVVLPTAQLDSTNLAKGSQGLQNIHAVAVASPLQQQGNQIDYFGGIFGNGNPAPSGVAGIGWIALGV
jgi:hypothetical protein